METTTAPPERPLPEDMSSTDPALVGDAFIALRRISPEKIAAFRVTMTPVETLSPGDVVDPNAFTLIWKRKIDQRILFNGEPTPVESALWTKNGKLYTTYLLDRVTWRGVMYPVYDAAKDSISFVHATPPPGYESITEPLMRDVYNFRMLLKASNFGCDKFLLMSVMTRNDVSRSASADTTYYLYAVKYPEKSNKSHKMYIPPMCNHFDDGRVCIRPDIGARNVSVDPDSIMLDLENAPGNLHLQKSNCAQITAQLYAKDYLEGEEPYLEVSCPTKYMINVAPQIPPVWNT